MFVNLKTFVIFAHDYKRKSLFFVSKISAKLIKTFKMEENIKKNLPTGFKKGLAEVYRTRTAAEYTRCLAETREVCTTTEAKGNSVASYYSKMNGRTALSVAETEKLNALFASYGVTDWQGIE